MLDLFDILLVFGISALTAVGAFWLLNTQKTAANAPPEAVQDPVSLLFDGGVLHHGTTNALTHFALQPGTHVWDDLRDTLVVRFPSMPKTAGTGDHGRLTMRATDDQTPNQLDISWRGHLCWVTLDQSTPQNAKTINDVDMDELFNLRRASASLPCPVWQEDASGKVFWYNDAYAALFQLKYGRPVQPAKRLFCDGDENAPKRVSLATTSEEDPDWYELSVISIDGATIFHATCINAVIKAEKAQRNFVQTLAKTFAHLPIGLAIFDRNGQLALFNPALVDLTKLPAHFLSARPAMLSFFDQLRENRRMPEPKNYLSWRQEISDVISAATDGRYQETWSLESGQTFSIKGRPYPDGATAFLIEDISAEVALTRSFRAELELGQSLLDTLDDGLAVFSANGILTFSNAAYRDMWQHQPEAAFTDVTILDCVSVWQSTSESTSLWQKVEDFIGAYEGRTPWNMPIIRTDGKLLTCELVPIAAGATLLRFREPTAAQNLTRELVQDTVE
jgi:PAS domain-containing protein